MWVYVSGEAKAINLDKKNNKLKKKFQKLKLRQIKNGKSVVY